MKLPEEVKNQSSTKKEMTLQDYISNVRMVYYFQNIDYQPKPNGNMLL